jgi:predicted O-methyltransferase YrrM
MIPDDQLDALLRRLWQEGHEFDAAERDPLRKRRNITPSTGRFLELLVQEERPRRILELGTSNGYSTLWLARAATVLGIPVDSVDHSPDKHAQARANLMAAGVLDQVQLHTTDADDFLRQSPSDHWDFIFLDSSRGSYIRWWPELQRCFSPGVLVVDNAVSHASELLPLQTLIDQQPHLERSVLTIGNGQLLVRHRPLAAAGQALVQLGVG